MDIAIQKTSLTVIIPVKICEAREDIMERIEYYKNDTRFPHNVNILIVDDGSPNKYYDRLVQIKDEKLQIIRTDAHQHQHFNLARARNYGAQHAKSEFIFFADVDLMPYPGFYSDILKEIVMANMDCYVDRFLMCPVIYLSQEFFNDFKNIPLDFRRQFVITAMLTGDTNLIEKYSHGTSAIIVNRQYYLSLGGQDIQFDGWGYEDYEFTTRLIRRNRQFPLSPDWLSMDGNFMTINTYRGWKAPYRLYGDFLGQKGIYMFHVPHSIDKSYHTNSERNLALLKHKMKEDQEKELQNEPLIDLSENKITLILKKNPFCYSKQFASHYGKVIFMSEKDFTDNAEFTNFLHSNNVNLVVFPNPYSNNEILGLYRTCLDKNISILVCERGALPDSVYHDKNGFLNDSKSYSSILWDRELSKTELDLVNEYIVSIRYGKDVLEKQADRKDLYQIRKELNIQNKKVVFVPFQQPQDTVIRFFAGEIKTFKNFYDTISELPNILDDEWCVVYKKHPTEDNLEHINNCICANDYNVYDLLEIADAVVLINSGVGIYGMMFGKPVYVLGDAWYEHIGLCVKVENSTELADKILNKTSIDYDKILKFIYYLRFDFYSFGKATQRRVRYPDGTPITATTDIRYYEIRNISQKPIFFPKEWKPFKNQSPLFDRYHDKRVVHIPSPSTKQQLHKSPQEVIKKIPIAEVKKANIMESSLPSHSTFRRKLNKFKKTPFLFIQDGLKKLYKK
jgi:predicted glycosyltransferase involved in capsule biosynthesis